MPTAQADRIRSSVLCFFIAGALSLLGAACTADSGRATPPGESATEDGASRPPALHEPDDRSRTRQGALASTPGGTGSIAEIPLIGVEWFGDYDAMVEQRVLRAVTPISKTFYMFDGAERRGVAYEALTMLEAAINEKLGNPALRFHVAIIPVTREELIPALVAGNADLAVGNLTITAARREIVDFSDPLLTDVDEVIVTGPESPEIATLADLSGEEIVVRVSSSYHDSLEQLNASFREAGLEPARLTPADEVLEDEDLLEMLNAGLLPLVVVDKHKADFWDQVFDHITVRHDLAVATGGQVAWAFRKNSPRLAAVINDFVVTHKKGTMLGNVVFNRYLKDTGWVDGALESDGRQRFEETAHFFQDYGARYDFPWLMVAAQAYQESKLDQTLRSSMGAVGVMQLLPTTAADPNVGIDNIDELENNIHAGVKYLRFIRDRYFADPTMDDVNRSLLSFAAYNAGPARIAGLRRQAAESGFDPDVWFGNVEVVAAREIGRETVQYVANIFKYYVAYKRIHEVAETRRRPTAQ